MTKITPALRLNHIHKSYRQGNGDVLRILQGVVLNLNAGQVVALLGPSGSGKSTLLHITGLLDVPDQGEIWINDVAAHHLNDKARTQLRRENLGFIYQFHHLFGEFTALENVMMPLLLQGVSPGKAKDQATSFLNHLGLGARLSHTPTQLSGGEQQRVAIARALIHNPKILLADEPTGNLDPETADQVFLLLKEHVQTQRIAALIATHNLELASRADHVIRLSHGQLTEISKDDIHPSA